MFLYWFSLKTVSENIILSSLWWKNPIYRDKDITLLSKSWAVHCLLKYWYITAWRHFWAGFPLQHEEAGKTSPHLGAHMLGMGSPTQSRGFKSSALSGLPWSAPGVTEHMQSRGAGWSDRNLKGREQENTHMNSIYTPTPHLVLGRILLHTAKSCASSYVSSLVLKQMPIKCHTSLFTSQ